MNPGFVLKSSPRKLLTHLIESTTKPVLLEAALPHSSYSSVSVLCANPIASIQLHQGTLTIHPSEENPLHSHDFLEQLRRLLAQWKPASIESKPFFTGGMVGYLSYDFAQSFWPNHQVGKTSSWPEAIFYLYDHSLAYFSETHHYEWFGELPSWEKDLFLWDQQEIPPQSPLPGIRNLTPLTSPKNYLEMILQIQEWIREGDVYQVNLAQRFTGEFLWSPGEVYSRLMETHPAPFSGFFPVDANHTLISASPELFFQLDQRHCRLRPIKGTAPRRKDPIQDHLEKHQLQQSMKDQAELLMIVDLERNDLGKVCEYGSILVPQLKSLESYATVHHLVATIEGKLAERYDVFDLIRALFPCGSITGAPKLRSMERIYQLESFARGPYTGSLGWIDFSGNAVFNVAIRSLLLEKSQLHLSVGGGITIDSTPQKELEETWHKGEGLLRGLGESFFKGK